MANKMKSMVLFVRMEMEAKFLNGILWFFDGCFMKIFFLARFSLKKMEFTYFFPLLEFKKFPSQIFNSKLKLMQIIFHT